MNAQSVKTGKILAMLCRFSIAPRLAAALALLLLTGCASLPQNATADPRDPLERFNRGAFAFNDGLDRSVIRPLARGYKTVTPQPVQTGVTNFFANASYDSNYNQCDEQFYGSVKFCKEISLWRSVIKRNICSHVATVCRWYLHSS